MEATRYNEEWNPDLTTRIAPDTETAKREDSEDQTRLQVYTDGSGYKEKIGAAAILYRGGKRISTLRYRLGNATEHTVYEGEIVGMILGLALISKEAQVTEVSMGVDNQAAIRATGGRKPTPSHYLMDRFHQELADTARKHPALRLTIRWTPGHSDIEGNEAVDIQAKRAAEGETSGERRIPRVLCDRLPTSKSATQQKNNEMLKKKAGKVWATTQQYNRINALVPNIQKRRHQETIRKLPRKIASMTNQLITGHIPLAGHLYRIGKVDHPACTRCYEEIESVAHYLLRCPATRQARKRLQIATGNDARTIQGLMKPNNSKPLFRFISDTRRFHSTFGELPDLPN